MVSFSCYYTDLCYFKTARDYFYVSCIEILQTVKLLSCFLLLKHSGFMRFPFFFLSLSPNFESKKNSSWKDCLLEKAS